MTETRYVIGFDDPDRFHSPKFLEPGVGDHDVSLSYDLDDAAKHENITSALNALVAASRKRNLTQYMGPHLVRIKRAKWEVDEIL